MRVERLISDPRQFEAFQALRLIECAHPRRARLGTAERAAHEPVRLGHDADLRFAGTQVTSYEPAKADCPARLALDFGLLGPDGPMPLHLTEYARARGRHQGDRTFERFLDVFHHRMSSLHYRAWASGQPVIGLDRPGDDSFARFVDSLCGLAPGDAGAHAPIGDDAKRGAAAWLGDRRRHASGLAALLADEVGAPVRIEPFVGQWLSVPESAVVRLGPSNRSALGDGYVLGRRAWDRQHKFRIVVGPLGAAHSERLHPGTAGLARMTEWARLYIGPTLDFEFELRLAQDAAPAMRLGAKTRLGRHTWLGTAKQPPAGPVLRFSGDGAIVSTTE
jgi:type VI secretion system protein ImpH